MTKDRPTNLPIVGNPQNIPHCGKQFVYTRYTLLMKKKGWKGRFKIAYWLLCLLENEKKRESKYLYTFKNPHYLQSYTQNKYIKYTKDVNTCSNI